MAPQLSSQDRSARNRSIIRLVRKPLAIALLAASSALIAAVGTASAQSPVTVRLAPVGGAPIDATATLTPAGEGTSVALTVTGLTPGQSYVSHVHSGTCAQPSASFGKLGDLVADASGRATLTSGSAAVSATGVPTNLPISLLTDGDHIIDLHAVPAAGAVACAAIPAAAQQPTGLPRTGTPEVAAGVSGALGLAMLGAAFLVRRREQR